MKEIREVLEQAREAIEDAMMYEMCIRGFVGAARILIFEIEQKEYKEEVYQSSERDKVIDRLVKFIKDSDCGFGPNERGKKIVSELLAIMNRERCLSESRNFCEAWKLTKKAFAKYISSDE